jgi:hypothetical protein
MQLKNSDDSGNNSFNNSYYAEEISQSPSQYTTEERHQNAYTYTQPTVKKSFSSEDTFRKIAIPILLGIVAIILIFVGKNFLKRYKKADYTPGTYSNGVYQNDFFEIKTNTGKDYKVTRYASDPAAIKNTLNSKKPVIEFQAENKSSIIVIGFIVEQTDYNVSEAGLDVDKLLEDAKSVYVKEAEQSGYKIETITRDSITIAGTTYQGFSIMATVNGTSTTMHLCQYYIFKENYMAAFTASSTSEAKSKQALTNCFISTK